MGNKEYIEKWLNGNLSDEELEQFKLSPDYQSMINLDKALQSYKAPDFDVETAFKSLQERKSTKEAKVIPLFNMSTLLRVAAVVVLAIFGYLLLFNTSETRVATKIAENAELDLPDQSHVWLNASSALTYDDSKWTASRTVDLQGEAYFKVSKGSKFDVLTSDGTISVLGTEFNVLSREGYFEVVCYEGHVGVLYESDTIHLLAGKGFQVINGEMRHLKSTQSFPSWTKQESKFEAVPFQLVLDELERQYDVVISKQNIELNHRFTGSFTHTNLELALRSVTKPLNLTFERSEEKHIVLSPE